MFYITMTPSLGKKSDRTETVNWQICIWKLKYTNEQDWALRYWKMGKSIYSTFHEDNEVQLSPRVGIGISV